MKNNQQEPVQVILTYTASSVKGNNLRAKIVSPAPTKAEVTVKPLDENHKLARRYSIDDNGGGYLGL
jgi:hypothetical protein